MGRQPHALATDLGPISLSAGLQSQTRAELLPDLAGTRNWWHEGLAIVAATKVLEYGLWDPQHPHPLLIPSVNILSSASL